MRLRANRLIFIPYNTLNVGFIIINHKAHWQQRSLRMRQQ
jgi:hypothetical protein